MDERFYQDYPYGSSRRATEADVQPLRKGFGPVAVLGGTVIRLPVQEPVLIQGGAGSAKFSQLGAYQLGHPSTQSFFALDVSGQMMSVGWHWNLAQRRAAYALNAFQCGAYPETNHPVNLWGILRNDTYLFDNARRIAEMAIPAGNKEGDNAWVGQGARRWINRLMMSCVLLEGRVTPKRLWQLINQIDGDDEALKSWGRACEGLEYDIYTTLIEIHNKKHGAEKEYGAIMGKIKDDLDWLSSPPVAESVSGDEDYLAYLADPAKKVGIYLVIPGGSGKHNQSYVRMVVGISQLHCVRANNGNRPLFYIEEAATCGNAEFIKSAVSEFRKYFRTVLVYQSHGQIAGLFGQYGAQEITESCGMQITMGGGIRDDQSAQRLARIAGKATIELDDPAHHDRRYKARRAALGGLMGSTDPLQARYAYLHELAQAQRKRKTSRDVIDLAEIMRLKEEVIISAPGTGVPIIIADKLPRYWLNPLMAGKFGPDPLFPPPDRVTIRRRFWGKSTRRFIRKPVPAHLADWPNHVSGEVAYVAGYRTW